MKCEQRLLLQVAAAAIENGFNFLVMSFYIPEHSFISFRFERYRKIVADGRKKVGLVDQKYSNSVSRWLRRGIGMIGLRQRGILMCGREALTYEFGHDLGMCAYQQDYLRVGRRFIFQHAARNIRDYVADLLMPPEYLNEYRIVWADIASLLYPCSHFPCMQTDSFDYFRIAARC